MKIGNNSEMKTKIAEAIFMVMNSESMINKWNMALHSHIFEDLVRQNTTNELIYSLGPCCYSRALGFALKMFIACDKYKN